MKKRDINVEDIVYAFVNDNGEYGIIMVFRLQEIHLRVLQ